MSLNPQWFMPIMSGLKRREVLKRAPLNRHPYKVYLYCTKGGEPVFRNGIIGTDVRPYLMNGTVCGEFTCVSTVEYGPPWRDKVFGTCLSAPQLYQYAAGAEKLCFMAIENPILYEKPKTLEDFGLTRAPMSWCYLKEGFDGRGI